jgi:hypothetical protein
VKRLKLTHEYHDSVLRSVEVRSQRVTFVVGLDPHWNSNVAETRHLFFEGAKNVDQVREMFGLTAGRDSAEIGSEILGILRDDNGDVLVDLATIGTLRIACKTLCET